MGAKQKVPDMGKPIKLQNNCKSQSKCMGKLAYPNYRCVLFRDVQRISYKRNLGYDPLHFLTGYYISSCTVTQ